MIGAVAVAAFVVDDDIEPGTKSEENETPFNAVIREFREETGITLETLVRD
jgi:8-oxo-dGTP pyrophosphatase MutT (NUDIX family)